MDYSRFQVAVIELANEGDRLTVANVVARLRVAPGEAEKHLDRMAKEGRLDVDVDENEGVVVYRVRGLTPAGAKSKLEKLRAEVERSVASTALERVTGGALVSKSFLKSTSPVPASMKRSVVAGALLAGIFPGVGLFYSAPWTVAAVATVAAAIAVKVLGVLPLILASPIMMVLCLVSGAAGALYTLRYNQHGKRSPLLEDDVKGRLGSGRTRV